MKSNLDRFLAKIDAISNDFGERVRMHILNGDIHQHLIISNNNLILEKDKNGAYTPYGCDLCLAITPGQNKDGIPTLGKEICLDAWQNGLNDNQIPREAMLNLWFCPKCRIPIASRVPTFE